MYKINNTHTRTHTYVNQNTKCHVETTNDKLTQTDGVFPNTLAH